MSGWVGCHRCGKVHRLPETTTGQRAICTRCEGTLTDPESQAASGAALGAAQRTAAAALAALILYFPAITLPILEIERLGHRHESSLISGTLSLFQHGDTLVGCVVLLFSLVLPLVKIALLLELSWIQSLHHRHRAWTYRAMELTGRWSMMDVLLLALLVMLVKVNDLVSFQIGPAVWAFTGCVLLSLLASCCFDPQAHWDRQESAEPQGQPL